MAWTSAYDVFYQDFDSGIKAVLLKIVQSDYCFWSLRHLILMLIGGVGFHRHVNNEERKKFGHFTC